MGRYAADPAWRDVIPIPQDDGGPNALAQIAYSEEYAEAMSYLRAVMAANDYSERVLELTETIIGMNPAHYTVWLYRFKTLVELSSDLTAELQWLNNIALDNLKNYQIWHHRQSLIDRIGSSDGEVAFIKEMFERDTKNYHVWSYRTWLVKRFGLWEGAGELESVEEMLKEDVRNNSAWNFRWFLVFAKDLEAAVGKKDVVEREIEFAKEKIKLAPQNQSPWNYLRGVLRVAEIPLSTIVDFTEQFASLEVDSAVKSSHALDLLADAYAEDAATKEKATQALNLLATTYDPIRANYWNYRKSLLMGSATAAAA